MNTQSTTGCIIGTAVGDALGLPYEGIPPRRARRMFGPADRHRFLFGRGMVSDDTEHTLCVAKALLEAGTDPERFERCLARKLSWWLAGLPAGVGWATLRSILKLCIGFPPLRSGVFSAGNGPAMRVPLLGVVFGQNPAELAEYVLRATRLTHSDPKAYQAALVTALAAARSTEEGPVVPAEFPGYVRGRWPREREADDLQWLDQACASAGRGEPVQAFAAGIGSRNGISGYALHTVPCVIQTWLRFQDDFAGGLREVIEAGGDTDTTGAILGGIVGARVGHEGIPAKWRTGILEWPRSVRWMAELGRRLAGSRTGGTPARVPACFRPAIPVRNLVFLLVVLFHGFRRLAPPY